MQSRLLAEKSDRDPALDNGLSSPPGDRRESDIELSGRPLAEPKHSGPRSSETPEHAPPEVSRRPNARRTVVAILVASLGFSVFAAWNTFLRYSAYGIVSGRVMELTSPWPAKVEAVYVRAGDTVRQGDILAIVSDPELDASIDRLGDEIRSAQAELDAQVALLAVAAHNRRDENQKIRANYYDLKGQLLSEESKLASLESKLALRLQLLKSGTVSNEEIDSTRYIIQGLNDKIEHLQQAVHTLEERLEESDETSIDEAALAPSLAKIEQFQAEIRRLRERQLQGTLRAPSGGTVMSISRHAGERVRQEDPFIELLQDGSIELVIFVQQDQASTFAVGQTIDAVVAPLDQQLSCEVVRIGDRYEKPVYQIQSHYRRAENLLPVHLRPLTDLSSETPLRLGSVVRIPAGW